MKLTSHYRFILTALLSACMFVSSEVHAADFARSGSDTNISAIYSDINMKLALASKENVEACTGVACQENQLFEERVANLGAKLAVAAYEQHPELEDKVNYFQFGIANKAEPGTASNTKGDIVLMRGLQDMSLSDEVLSFVIAREMGHVIAGHHVRNTKTKLLISALSSVLFPAVAIISASNTLTQASTLTSVASSVTSLVGSEVAMINVKPKQLIEADNIAINILEQQGVSMQAIADQLRVNDTDTSWLKDLQESKLNLAEKLDQLKPEDQAPVLTYAYSDF